MHRHITAGLLLTLTASLLGCNNTGRAALDDGLSGAEDGSYLKDARLIADVFIWDCYEGEKTYPGPFAHHVSLEYAPDALRPLQLPSAGGCTYGLDMFPTTAGAGGVDLVGITGDPEWETASHDGEFRQMGVGFYFDDVLGDDRVCGNGARARLEGGTELVDAGRLSGIVTPQPSDIPDVTLGGFGDVVSWGDEIDISVSPHDWEQVWVQLRRENSSGEAMESVTCNITGLDEFRIDEQIWSMLNEDINIERNNLYVAFQRVETVRTNDDDLVDVFTRVIDPATILD